MGQADGRRRWVVLAAVTALGVAAAALLVGAVWWGPAPGLPGLAAAAARAARGGLAQGLAALSPGWLPAALVDGLTSAGLGPVAAVRAVWTLGALGTLLGFAATLRGLGRDARLLSLALPLVYAGALGRGELGATLGTALLFAAVAAGRAYVRGGSAAALAGLGGALLAAFSTHEALSLAAWGTSALVLLAAPGSGARRGAALVATLPAAALWAAWRFALPHGAPALAAGALFAAGPPEALGPLGPAGWFLREGFDFLSREYDGTALWILGGLWLVLAGAPASSGSARAPAGTGGATGSTPRLRAWLAEAAPALAALGLAGAAVWTAPNLSTAGALVAPTLLWLVLTLRPERGGALAGLALTLAGLVALWFGVVVVLSAQRFERREVAPMLQGLAAALPGPGGASDGGERPRVVCVGCQRDSVVYRRGPLPAVFEALALDLGRAGRASGAAGRGTPGALPARGWQAREALGWWDAVVVLGRHLAPPGDMAARLGGAEARTSWDTPWVAYRPRPRRRGEGAGQGASGARQVGGRLAGGQPAGAPEVAETGLQGGSGGRPHRWDCPDRMALLELRGARSADRKRVASVTPVCARLHRHGRTLRAVGPRITGPALGVAPRSGSPVQARCPEDALLTGLDGWAGLVVERLEGACTRFEARAGAWHGGGAGGRRRGGTKDAWRRESANRVHVRCAPGEVAVGVSARAGVELDAIGLRCAAAAALVSPPAPKAARFPGRPYDLRAVVR